MRKFLFVVALVVAFVIPAAALAASLNTGKFQEYIGEGAKCQTKSIANSGAWYHFVLNKIDPAINKDDLRLTAMFSPDADAVDQAPWATNNGTAHWWIFSPGHLDGAQTVGDTNPGLRAMLVLSSYECGKKGILPSDDD